MYPALDPLRAPGKVSGIPRTPAQPLHAFLGALPARPPICISVCRLSVSGALPLSHFGKSTPTKLGVSMPATNRTAANRSSGFSAAGAREQTGSSPLCLLLPRGAVRCGAWETGQARPRTLDATGSVLACGRRGRPFQVSLPCHRHKKNKTFLLPPPLPGKCVCKELTAAHPPCTAACNFFSSP